MQASINPENTVFDAKRLIGRKFSDPNVQKDIMSWPFKVVSGDYDKPMISVKYKGQEKLFHAEQISSFILTNLKETAEAYLQSPVKDAVITVPAYFNDAQWNATMDAGLIAGLNVVRIINEPTAAAIAYGLDKLSDCASERNIFVFDLGGGTFDVSLLTIKGNVFEVKATAGNTHIGGEDFVNRMMDYFVKEFNKKKRKNKMDITSNPRALRRLRTECEKAKIMLSFKSFTSIAIDNLYKGIDFISSISRSKFEEINMDLFNECMKTVENCFKDSGIDKSSVDDIVLVGSSSRIPKVQELLCNFFNGKELCKSINPDEAVAFGAAIQAAVLNEGIQNGPKLVLQEVTPLSLGIRTRGDVMDVNIPRNTSVPVMKKKIFQTAADNQTFVPINVYEGERLRTIDNNFLGSFYLICSPGTSRGNPLEICFSIDQNGILMVSAKDNSSGNINEMKITNDKERLSADEVKKLIEEAKKYQAEDEKFLRKARVVNELDGCVYKLRNLLKNNGSDSNLSTEEIEQINNAITLTANLFDKNQLNVDLLEDHLKEFESMLKQLTVKRPKTC